MPSSTISGAAPWSKLTIGVPHANASIITSPNGSAHLIGLIRARAVVSSSIFVAKSISPT